jgi:cytochrome P450
MERHIWASQDWPASPDQRPPFLQTAVRSLAQILHDYVLTATSFEGDTPNIIDTDVEGHTRMRRIFSNAFSDRSLKQQEPLFLSYVDKLMALLRSSIGEDPDKKFDMVQMYNYTTFDVMVRLVSIPNYYYMGVLKIWPNREI